MKTNSLSGCTIIVTRPAAQAGTLIKKLENLGANTFHFPVIEINATEDHEQALVQASTLNTYDITIFISKNAAIYGAALIKQAGNWPQNIQVAAIGNGTAEQLKELGIATDIVARGIANSESLLSESAMHSVSGKRILIFRGNGGREKLADELRKRGAIVEYLQCYERKRPDIDADALTRLWDRNTMHGIILTSAEGLKNLYQMVKKEDIERLNTTPLYVISSTMVELCGKLGYKLTPILMPSARDDDVLNSVLTNCTLSSP